MKKALSLILALVLLIGMLPQMALPARAEETVSATTELEGKTISILGASISTYTGISNNTAYNSTIGSNAVYYTEGRHGVYADDTWWMQVCDDLGLRLLVNNSWSGSALLHTRNGTVGAYVDRCVQLHDNTGDNAGEEPDIIGIQMGSNDFQYYKDTLGTADIDYDALIAENEDGSFTYATPVTSLEAAAIVLHKISVRYPNAEVYYLNVSQRIDGTDAKSFNAELKKVVEHFGAHIVDIYGSVITPETFDTHIGDGRVHPNKLGMDAYTEAFKRALLDNTAYDVDAHTVSLNLDGVTADYGDDKIVISGDSYTVNLTAAANMGLDVTVIMGGKDITATAYANGTVTVSSVSDDVTITAKSVYDPKDYRWEFDGTDLTCVNGGNALTKKAGTTTNGVFNKTCYALANEVVLLHNLPWSVEWKSEGTFMNTNGSTGARIFTSDDVNANYNARYIFKSATNWLIAMGEKDTKGSHNYGIALGDYGIDGSAPHTYRLENRIAADGSNMIYLFVDGEEIGPMIHYYVGSIDKKTTSGWLSGKDFVFPYMGTDTHGFTNASIDYIQVWEGGVPQSGPVITQQPESVQQEVGKKFAITVMAEGDGLTYQWYVKDSGAKAFKISSNKTASYAYTMQTYMHNRQVYCVVTDANGNSVQTETATISRPPQTLKILQQPQDARVNVGQKFNISPKVEGEGLIYQWYVKENGAKAFKVSSVRGSAYALTMQKYMIGRQVYCVITDKHGNSVTTDVATISLPPVELKILEQPSDVYASKGEKFSISPKVQGEGLTYQWYYKEGYMKIFKPSSNKTSAYAYSMQLYMNERSVYCVITDKFGNQVQTEAVTIYLGDLITK